MQKGIGIIRILVILALLLGGGGYWLYNYWLANFEVPPQISPERSNVVDTSSWKTYRDDDLGFEFQYPSDWDFITEFLPGGVVKDNFFKDKNGRVMTIIPFLYDTNYTFEEYVGANFEPGSEDVRLSGKNKLIDNDSMEAYLVPMTNGVTWAYLRSKKYRESLIGGKYQKTVTLKSRKDLDTALFKRIISTFKFIKNSAEIEQPPAGFIATPPPSLPNAIVRYKISFFV